MKRLFTFIALVLIIAAGYYLIAIGLDFQGIKISSYKEINDKSDGLTSEIARYKTRSQDEYANAKTGLETTVKSFKASKTKYEDIVGELEAMGGPEDEGETVEDIIYSDKQKYKVDFLLVTLGDYGERNGVEVNYQLVTSATVDPNAQNLNYFLADLVFSVSGQYMDVTNFLSDLETDDKLDWRVRNLTMTGSGDGVSCTFTIQSVPIDSESYIDTAGTASSQPVSDGGVTPTTPTDGSVPTPDASQPAPVQ